MEITYIITEYYKDSEATKKVIDAAGSFLDVFFVNFIRAEFTFKYLQV